jgi:hypothetical protein
MGPLDDAADEEGHAAGMLPSRFDSARGYSSAGAGSREQACGLGLACCVEPLGMECRSKPIN